VHEDIMQLKNNYDTPLGDQGILRLSSSFIQKLILARVYLKDSNVFIFDNPYISANRVEEQKFIDSIQQLKKNRIVLLTTSKLSYLEVADQIIYLKAGQVAAAGHPSQVLSGILEEYGVKK
jgi:ATP-binding cassette subfamily C protein/ATP-binding cassette subfamily C protein LapB